MAVAEALHISRAAEKLHVAQPAVSEQSASSSVISASSCLIARGGGSR